MIRAAKDADIEDLEGFKGGGPTRAAVLVRLEKQRRGKLHWLLYEESGRILAWVDVLLGRAHDKAGKGEMVDLFVTEDERGRGIGTKLIRECEKRAKAKGFSRIWLAVNPEDNPRARQLYERLGYCHDGGELYLDGVYGDYEDWVINLEKEI